MGQHSFHIWKKREKSEMDNLLLKGPAISISLPCKLRWGRCSKVVVASALLNCENRIKILLSGSMRLLLLSQNKFIWKWRIRFQPFISSFQGYQNFNCVIIKCNLKRPNISSKKYSDKLCFKVFRQVSNYCKSE